MILDNWKLSAVILGSCVVVWLMSHVGTPGLFFFK